MHPSEPGPNRRNHDAALLLLRHFAAASAVPARPDGRTMASVIKWTARQATHLQAAAHLSSEGFAELLEVSPRTVARWHENPDTVPRPTLQRLLDEALASASREVQERFTILTDEPASPVPGMLHVAVAVVLNDDHVLLVRRRADDSSQWQFPAGVVKPESSPEAVAVRETFAETGIDCTVRSRIGDRTHPKTGVFCVYLLCDYLAGEPENRDPVENDSVRWAPRHAVGKFIPVDNIFHPVRVLLQEPA